jgi:hypothetical protein
MKPSKKIDARLSVRVKDYQLTMSTKNPHNGKVESRKENGGFHCPGSRQKK